MADEHFWDNGVSSISQEESCRLDFETINGEKKTTPLMTIDKALKLMDVLKNGRETVSCVAVKVDNGVEQNVQSFKLNVIEVDGRKIII